MKLDFHEKDYRRIANRTGIYLIIFIAIFNATGIAAAVLA